MREKTNRRVSGLTLLEVVVVVAVIALLGVFALLLMPPKVYQHAARMKCHNNQKEIYRALHAYKDDHGNKTPWMEHHQMLRDDPQAWKFFQILSNELGSPRALVCPADVRRDNRADHFQTSKDGVGLPKMGNKGISYFIAVHTNINSTNAIALGDRNISSATTESAYSSENSKSAIVVPANSVWSQSPRGMNHKRDGGIWGNVTFADGGASFIDDSKLQWALSRVAQANGTNANKFLFPQ